MNYDEIKRLVGEINRHLEIADTMAFLLNKGAVDYLMSGKFDPSDKTRSCGEFLDVSFEIHLELTQRVIQCSRIAHNCARLMAHINGVEWALSKPLFTDMSVGEVVGKGSQDDDEGQDSAAHQGEGGI